MRFRVEELLDLKTGRALHASEMLQQFESELFQLRRNLEEAIQIGEPYLVCAYCGSPLKLRAGGETKYRLHFAHLKDSPECPIKTGPKLSKNQILALKFNGAKESQRHIRLKNRIAEVLHKDSRFTDVKVENVVKDQKERMKWRKPDVSARFLDRTFVFEVQLSTTFLSVIVERALFYRNNSIPIVWVFDQFDPADTRFTDRDIFYNNKSNALVFDDETFEKSFASDTFFLKVYYYKPVKSESGKIAGHWMCDTVDFSQIQYQDDAAFYFDGDREFRVLQYKNEKEQFFGFLRSHPGERINVDEFGNHLERFSKYGLTQSEGRSDNVALCSIFSVLLSLSDNLIVGFRFRNELQLVHHIYDHHNDYFPILVEFLRKSGIESRILSLDRKGTYRSRVGEMQLSESRRAERFRNLLHYFFPSIDKSEV